ncbi:hypothetical protein QCA50_006284 [Cerrena zonata]|uniref:Uncharacterized protein n=1 Tax=Cerrena zonata TaxID=2478898 RepID=A0AAW0GEK6_9APHY
MPLDKLFEIRYTSFKDWSLEPHSSLVESIFSMYKNSDHVSEQKVEWDVTASQMGEWIQSDMGEEPVKRHRFCRRDERTEAMVNSSVTFVFRITWNGFSGTFN